MVRADQNVLERGLFREQINILELCHAICDHLVRFFIVDWLATP